MEIEINGNYSELINILDSINRTFSKAEQPVYHIRLSMELNSDDLLLINKNSLQPLDSYPQENVDCFAIDKNSFYRFKNAYENSCFISVNNSNAIKTETEREETKTGPYDCNKSDHSVPYDVPSYPVNMVPADHSNRKVPEGNYDDLYIIENHESSCVSQNRPAVMAIKQLGENYYLLFYRRSVYDAGVDTSFRSYLSQQPGVLVAYRYFHFIDNLRSEFGNLGLSLRHNGKNELSKYQADQILHKFKILEYM